MTKNTPTICALLLTLCLCIGTATVQSENIPANNRELRYIPDSSSFLFQGSEPRLFNRALYGSNQAFRLETGDLPEFGFYASCGMSGNVQFALRRGEKIIWLKEAENIQCRYLPGKRIYHIQDSLIGNGKITLTAIARYDKEGAIFCFETENTPDDLELLTMYGGARGKKFSRNGDMGVDPADAFCLKKDYCRYNRYDLQKNAFQVWFGVNEDIRSWSKAALLQPENKVKTLYGIFPENSTMSVGDAQEISDVQKMISAWSNFEYPILRSIVSLPNNQDTHIAFSMGILDENDSHLATAFQASCDSAEQIAAHLKIYTPDPFINAVGGALAMAADGIWESPSYYHGAIGWRSRLAGWRGAYTGDALGWHDRAREHFRAYAASQMTIANDKAVIMDTALNLARSAKILGTPMYSDGYIARYPNNNGTMNHYDMNLCYIDELLWHLRWTGDMDFAKEIWPVLVRHLAWEKRCFDADNDGLYDAYCCIWASDALQYSGGGVTHSSAYNYRANAVAAEIAALIGENPTPYLQEAEKIRQAIQDSLWVEDEGHWAEFQDALGLRLVHPSAGLWTIYHAIDSRIHDSFQAYQALRYVDTEIPHIPVKIKDTDPFYMEPDLAVLSTTNWQPYYWSINNVVFAEIMHTALAYFQGGRYDEGYTLMKSAIMDGMYLGGSPGNVGQISFYDIARGEAYRDFADPVGVYSRAIVQGLFGVIPDMMHQTLFLRPAFPASWDSVTFETPDIQYSYKRYGDGTQHWQIMPHFSQKANLIFEIPIRHDQVWMVKVNGKAAKGQFDKNAIGHPVLRIFAGAEDVYHIEIQESNRPLPSIKYPSLIAIGEDMEINMPDDLEMIQVYDPQNLLKEVQFSPKSLFFQAENKQGHHTFFIECKNETFSWWQAIEVELRPILEILRNEKDTTALSFYVINHSQNQNIDAELWLNNQKTLTKLSFPARSTSDMFYIEAPQAIHGSNVVQLRQGKDILQQSVISNWAIPFETESKQVSVPIEAYFNDPVSRIFEIGKYLSPRSPYTTLQIPTQGYGDWCSPKNVPKIDDSGLRALAKENNCFTTPQGIVFRTPSQKDSDNIAFTSQWDNYPNEITIPLQQKASHAYFLMAGSTNHTQCNMTNGLVIAEYTDNTADTLRLITPDNWAPIEQDYRMDGKAFRVNAPHPYRLYLADGQMTREYNPSVMIPGGAAILLDMPLHAKKKLKDIRVVTLTNENVIGLLSLTLIL